MNGMNRQSSLTNPLIEWESTAIFDYIIEERRPVDWYGARSRAVGDQKITITVNVHLIDHERDRYKQSLGNEVYRDQIHNAPAITVKVSYDAQAYLQNGLLKDTHSVCPSGHRFILCAANKARAQNDKWQGALALGIGINEQVLSHAL